MMDKAFIVINTEKKNYKIVLVSFPSLKGIGTYI